MLSPVGLAATITASIVLAACGWFQELPVYSVINESDETLVLSGVRTEERGFNTQGETELAVLQPGERTRVRSVPVNASPRYS